ncbi:2'-5' RNA ligase family protein [Frankia sp. R82]|uniref:2'-5' RNA ligase family protein n=1 Tax=Frankia sp. R82 TaxID=2950553 RepID=UPI002042D6FC|nr:2'-5' RNA ligase family protein [Frankia sp. R82]MCM3883073.1 2'-5' RNA ligase family protein [Frankia sp. R82]
MRDFWGRHLWPAGERRWHWHLLPPPEAATRLVDAYELGVCPEVDAVPAGWMHLTLLSVGPIGAASPTEMVAAVAERCAGLAPVRLTLGPAYVARSGVLLRVAPEAPVVALYQAIVGALGMVESASFRPHVSLGYGTRDQADDSALQAWLDARHPPPVEITVSGVSLVDQVQDLQARQYRWTPQAHVDFTGPAAGTPTAGRGSAP